MQVCSVIPDKLLLQLIKTWLSPSAGSVIEAGGWPCNWRSSHVSKDLRPRSDAPPRQPSLSQTLTQQCGQPTSQQQRPPLQVTPAIHVGLLPMQFMEAVLVCERPPPFGLQTVSPPCALIATNIIATHTKFQLKQPCPFEYLSDMHALVLLSQNERCPKTNYAAGALSAPPRSLLLSCTQSAIYWLDLKDDHQHRTCYWLQPACQ